MNLLVGLAASALRSGLLADDAPRNTGPDFGKASPFGLLVIVLLLLGTFVLVWSMNRQLRKVPAAFDRDDPGSGQAGDDDSAASDGDGEAPAGGDGSPPLSDGPAAEGPTGA